VEPAAPPVTPPPSSASDGSFDFDDSFDLDLSEQEARAPSDQPLAPAAGVAAIHDLPALRTALESSDGSAAMMAAALKNMASVAESLSRAELTELHKDPLMEEIVDFMDAQMYRFTASSLAVSLWSFAKLRYVPGRRVLLLRALSAVHACT
jgi:hypothetical protein